MIIKNLELKIACTKGAQISLKFSAFYCFISKDMSAPKCAPKKLQQARFAQMSSNYQKTSIEVCKAFIACNFCIEKFDFLIQKSNSKL